MNEWANPPQKHTIVNIKLTFLPMSRPNQKLPTLLPAVLTLGIISQIGQAIILRELLMVFHGSELSIGLILAAWLLWVGLGSRLGSGLTHRIKNPFKFLTLTAALLGLFLPFTILAIRRLRDIFNLLPGTYFSLQEMALTCLIIMAPACLLLGFQFIMLARIWREDDHREDTASASKTYISEASGNMLGGLLFTFLMVRNLNTIQSTLIIALLMPAAVLLLVWKSGKTVGYLRWALFAIMLVLLGLIPFSNDIEQWSLERQWHAFSPGHQLVAAHQSQHGTVTILSREGQYHVYQSGHLVFSTAGPGADQPGMENQDAVTFAHFSMTMHEDPQQVLLIGGGLRGLLNEIIKHPIENIDYIELDEVLTDAVTPYIPADTRFALQDPRVQLIHTDGRLFVKTTAEKYDLIIVDVPDPATAVLNRYYTREFFKEAQSRLNPQGVLFLSTMSTPDLRSLAVSNRNATIYHTLASVFPEVALVGEQFLFYIASNGTDQLTLDPLALQERFETRDIQTEGFAPHQFQVLLYEPNLRRVSWVLRHHGRTGTAHRDGPGQVPILIPDLNEQEHLVAELPPVNERFFNNADFQPIGYFYTVMFLEALTRAGQVETLERVLSIQPGWLLTFLGLPLLATIGLQIGQQTQIKKLKEIKLQLFSVLFCVFSTGFSSMMIQVALIFSFQSIYGFVYEIIGVIMALFMFGLALGASFTNRYIKDKGNMTTLAIFQVAIVIFAVMMAFGLPTAARAHSPGVIFALFALLTFAAGVINGAGFPQSAGCALRSINQPDKSAGMVYSMEVLGACLGAVLASVLIAPIYGIIACCIIAGFMNLSAFVMLTLTRRS